MADRRGETMQYVVIEPVINERAVAEYAHEHNTEHPFDHIEGALKTLHYLATVLDDLEDDPASLGLQLDTRDPLAAASASYEHIARVIRMRHRIASADFLRMFGDGRPAEDVDAPEEPPAQMRSVAEKPKES